MGVVVRFDVGEELDLSVVLVDKTAALKHLGFDRADDAFAPRVVVGIGPGRHALADAGLFEKCAKRETPVLTSAVAMEDGVLRFGT